MTEERFQRMELLVGPDAMQLLQQASVAVFGIGGVGSYAVEALVRAGVGRLTLVDFDRICPSNINRQIHALESTVGQNKVEAMAQRCREINPAIDIHSHACFYQPDNSAELLAGPYHYVLDCIDSISSKLHLIESCTRQQIPIISSMGAANKLDPALIRVDDIAATTKCRLARTIRKQLRQRGIEKGVQVVYSTEEFRPLNNSDSAERTPLLGSASWLPPLFGLTMASEVIRRLIAK